MALLSHGSNAGCITRLSLKGDIDSSETDIVPYRQRIVGISTVQGLGERGPVQISTKGVLLKRLTPIVQELCESRWPSWAVRPNELSGFRGRKAILNHASALVSACP